MNVLERLGRAVLEFESESERHAQTIATLRAVVEGKIDRSRFSFGPNSYTISPEVKATVGDDAKS